MEDMGVQQRERERVQSEKKPTWVTLSARKGNRSGQVRLNLHYVTLVCGAAIH